MKKKKISALFAVFALLTAGPLTGCGKKERKKAPHLEQHRRQRSLYTITPSQRHGTKMKQSIGILVLIPLATRREILRTTPLSGQRRQKPAFIKTKSKKVFALSANTRQKEQMRALVSMNGEQNGRVISLVIGMRQLVQAMLR